MPKSDKIILFIIPHIASLYWKEVSPFMRGAVCISTSHYRFIKCDTKRHWNSTHAAGKMSFSLQINCKLPMWERLYIHVRSQHVSACCHWLSLTSRLSNGTSHMTKIKTWPTFLISHWDTVDCVSSLCQSADYHVMFIDQLCDLLSAR